MLKIPLLLVLFLAFLMIFVFSCTAEVEPEKEVVDEPEQEEAVEEANETLKEEVDPVSAETAEYLSLMYEITRGLEYGILNLEDIVMDYETTEQWYLDAGANAMLIGSWAKKAEEIEPPEKYKESHATYLQGIKKYTESEDWFVKTSFGFGVTGDELDPVELEKAWELIEEGNAYIKQAVDKMLALE